MASGVALATAGIAVTNSAVSLVFGALGTQIGSGLDAVALDAVVKESFRTTSKVTDHPIESGSVVSDNIIDEPDELQLEGVISNTPIMLLASARMSSTHAEDEYSKLLKLKEAKEAISVYTSKREYEDFVITTISRPRESSLGDSVGLSLTLRKIRLVESKQVSVQRSEGIQKPKTKRGRVAKKPATQAQSSTVLLKIGQATGRVK